MAETVVCWYCEKPAALVTGQAIYPHRTDLYAKPFYHCEPCKAWVGCHPGTTTPLGRLADVELRAAKQQVHAAFDPHWRGVKKKHARSKAYKRLARELEIPLEECHVGMFDVERCRKALALVQAWGPRPRHGRNTTRRLPMVEMVPTDPRDDKKRFVKLQIQGSSAFAICRPEEVADFCDGEKYIETDVWMTESEYSALPEFEGY